MPRHRDKYRVLDDEDEDAEIERIRKRRRQLYEDLGVVNSIVEPKSDINSGKFSINSRCFVYLLLL